MRKYLLACLCVVIAGLFAFTGCQPVQKQDNTIQQTSSEDIVVEYPCDILQFPYIENTDKLSTDIKYSRIPTSCDVLYDQMGTLPNVAITKRTDIILVYKLLSSIQVVGESDVSITDSYHHIYFTLQDGTVVRFQFEGENLLNIGTRNFQITGGLELWQFIRQLQE